MQGGATWGEVDRATHEHGLAVPCGIISTTGVGGLTLGGGIGHLSRKYGLAIDSLLAADMVLADGSTVTASEDQNEDLFWAVARGRRELRRRDLVPVPRQPGRHGAGRARCSGRSSRPRRRCASTTSSSPTRREDVNGFFAFLTVPPGDPFPAGAAHAQGVRRRVVLHRRLEQAEEALRPAREFGPPLLDGVQQMPFPDMQSAFDEVYPPGLQWYWRADFVDELPDEAIAAHAEYGAAAAEHALDHAPVPDRRSGARRRARTRRRSPIATRAGRR